MKIIINNAQEAEMPFEMIAHCEQLLKKHIINNYSFLPEQGQELAILYSETDPLQQSAEVDNAAYFLYFGVAEIDCSNETDRETATIYVDIAY